MRKSREFVASALVGLLVLGSPAYAGPIEDKAKEVSTLLGHEDEDDALSAKKQTKLLATLSALTPLQRFRVMKVLDQKQASDLRTIHDRLSAPNQQELLRLCKESGDAATAAGLQEVGIISDVDDTAVPTDYQPDGKQSFAGARAFYDDVTQGTVHYVSARPGIFVPETIVRLQEAGMPAGTFDTRSNLWGVLFGGDGDIEKSKVANIETWIALHPGQRFVFLGDTIQRDPEVYRTILKDHPEAVAAVFIHEASGPSRNAQDYAGETFFQTYADAKSLWDAHATDPKPLGTLTPAGTHDVQKTAGFFSSVKTFFHDATVVAKQGFTTVFHKIGF